MKLYEFVISDSINDRRIFADIWQSAWNAAEEEDALVHSGWRRPFKLRLVDFEYSVIRDGRHVDVYYFQVRGKYSK